MNKEEALAKIKELEEYIKNLDNPVGFNNDRVFLLSVEEYERYKNKIPKISCWWWLRSPGNYQYHAANVDYYGSVVYFGLYVDNSHGAVRPALKYEGLENIIESKHSSRFIWNEVRWVIIDEENKVAISEMPIAFNKFDSESNDYENSWIRAHVLNWGNYVLLRRK